MRSSPNQRADSHAIIFMDGRLVARHRARVSIEDWGFRYGWGAFETIRVSRGKPVFLSRHLARFSQNARALLLPHSDEWKWWHNAIIKVVAHAPFEEGALNLYWTRGKAPLFRGSRIISLRPQLSRRPGNGRIWVAPWRLGQGVPGVGTKTLAYLPYTYSGICAQAAGFADAVLVNRHGRIADGSSASVFLIDGGRLLTPPVTEGALDGITRGVVLELAGELGIETKVVPLPVRRLRTSDGVFLTSVLRGLRPVKEVDGQRVPMSTEARHLFVRLRRAHARAVTRDLEAFR